MLDWVLDDDVARCSVEAVSWLEGKTQVPAKCGDIIVRLAAVIGDVDIVFASGLTDPSASEAARPKGDL